MDPLTQFDVIVPMFQQVASATATDQLDSPTPCDQWRVRDLFGHVIGGATSFAAAVRGDASPPEIGSVDDEAMSATASAAVADVDAAFRTPGAMERTIATPFGDMGGDTFARLLAFDLLVHSSDLATATRQDLVVDDALVAEVEGFARSAISPEMRGPDTFAAEVAPAAGATPLERLVAFSGRTG